MIEENKIDFFGKPVAHGMRSKVLACARGPDGNLPLISTLFSAAAVQLCCPSVSPAGILACSLCSGAISAIHFQALKALEISGWEQRSRGVYKKTKQMVINTKPNLLALPTKPEWLLFAKRAKTLHEGAVFAGVMVVGLALCGVTTSLPSSVDIPVSAVVGGGAILRGLAGVRRWSKVLLGDWVVEAAPKPVPVAVKSKARQRFGIAVPEGA